MRISDWSSDVCSSDLKFKAVNNRDRNFTRGKMERRLAQIEESVARYLHQLDSADRQEPSPALTNKTTRLREKMNRLAALDAQMREAPDQQVSLTDPDSRSMATRFRRGGLRRAGSGRRQPSPHHRPRLEGQPSELQSLTRISNTHI